MASLSRKHFREIAANLAKIDDDDTRERRAKEMADTLATTNPQFNRAKFLDAAKAGPKNGN